MKQLDMEHIKAQALDPSTHKPILRQIILDLLDLVSELTFPPAPEEWKQRKPTTFYENE